MENTEKLLQEIVTKLDKLEGIETELKSLKTEVKTELKSIKQGQNKLTKEVTEIKNLINNYIMEDFNRLEKRIQALEQKVG